MSGSATGRNQQEQSNGCAVMDTSLLQAKPGVNCRMRVFYFRCYWPSLLYVWPTFQIWGRSHKKRSHYRKVLQTDRQTYTQVILYLSNVMHYISQTTIPPLYTGWAKKVLFSKVCNSRICWRRI